MIELPKNESDLVRLHIEHSLLVINWMLGTGPERARDAADEIIAKKNKDEFKILVL